MMMRCQVLLAIVLKILFVTTYPALVASFFLGDTNPLVSRYASSSPPSLENSKYTVRNKSRPYYHRQHQQLRVWQRVQNQPSEYQASYLKFSFYCVGGGDCYLNKLYAGSDENEHGHDNSDFVHRYGDGNEEKKNNNNNIKNDHPMTMTTTTKGIEVASNTEISGNIDDKLKLKESNSNSNSNSDNNGGDSSIPPPSLDAILQRARKRPLAITMLPYKIQAQMNRPLLQIGFPFTSFPSIITIGDGLLILVAIYLNSLGFAVGFALGKLSVQFLRENSNIFPIAFIELWTVTLAVGLDVLWRNF
mmetsp:Transcript_9298/g.13824  ORF Transcript_9298/g.13824 Transcript_9298/m.13824 type:complete len:304 (-) Transcript_9298:116-1027(-)